MSEAIIHTGMPVADALTNGSPATACLARMSVSKMASELTEFINAEMERGTTPATLLHTLALFQIQTHASITAHLLTLNGLKIIQEHYMEILAEEYVEHGVRTMQAINERKVEAAL